MNLNWYGRTVGWIDDSTMSMAELDRYVERYLTAGRIVRRRFRIKKWLR